MSQAAAESGVGVGAGMKRSRTPAVPFEVPDWRPIKGRKSNQPSNQSSAATSSTTRTRSQSRKKKKAKIETIDLTQEDEEEEEEEDDDAAMGTEDEEMEDEADMTQSKEKSDSIERKKKLPSQTPSTHADSDVEDQDGDVSLTSTNESTPNSKASHGRPRKITAPASTTVDQLITPTKSSSKSPTSITRDSSSSPTSSNTRQCPHCSMHLFGKFQQHVDDCAKRTSAEREKHSQRLKSRQSLSQLTSQPTKSIQSTPKSTNSKTSTSSSKKSSPSTPPSRTRTKKGAVSMKTGLVKSVSSFPISEEAIKKKVGYKLGVGEEDEEEEMPVYEVEAIRSRRFNPELMQFEYEIKWRGWDEVDNTWQRAIDTNCPELIKRYHIEHEQFLVDQVDDAVEIAEFEDPCVAFHRDGYCTLRSPELSLTPAQVKEADEFVTKEFNKTYQWVVSTDQLVELEEVGFDRFKMRTRGRYDLTIDPSKFPFMANPPWLSTVNQIFGGHAYLKHVGCMMSKPGSETQPYHQDGPHKDEKTHLPCYMLNVFVPLIDMTKALGGTEFIPGSHVLHDYEIRTTKQIPLIKAGQCLLFDYRIQHRGMSNNSTKDRPCLYFSYAGSPDIKDDMNFQSGPKKYRVLPNPIPEPESRGARYQKRIQQKGEPEQPELKDESKEEEQEEEEVVSEEEEEEDGNESSVTEMVPVEEKCEAEDMADTPDANPSQQLKDSDTNLSSVPTNFESDQKELVTESSSKRPSTTTVKQSPTPATKVKTEQPQSKAKITAPKPIRSPPIEIDLTPSPPPMTTGQTNSSCSSSPAQASTTPIKATMIPVPSPQPASSITAPASTLAFPAADGAPHYFYYLASEVRVFTSAGCSFVVVSDLAKITCPKSPEKIYPLFKIQTERIQLRLDPKQQSKWVLTTAGVKKLLDEELGERLFLAKDLDRAGFRDWLRHKLLPLLTTTNSTPVTTTPIASSSTNASVNIASSDLMDDDDTTPPPLVPVLSPTYLGQRLHQVVTSSPTSLTPPPQEHKSAKRELTTSTNQPLTDAPLIQSTTDHDTHAANIQNQRTFITESNSAVSAMDLD